MHGELNEQLPLYALGALHGAEADKLEQHLAAGCDECDRELLEFDRIVDGLAFAAPPVEAPAGLRGRVMASIGSVDQVRQLRVVGEPQASARSRPAGAAFGIAALLAAAAIAIVFMGWALISAGSRIDESVRQLADARASEAARQAEIDRQRQLLELAADPASRTTALKATSGESTAGLNVVWHPGEKRGVLVASGLPSVESGKAYELWLVSGSTPVPAAVFNTDAAGNAIVEIDRIDNAGAPNVFAITVEPASGSKLPTGKILMAGEYSGA
ncbi:MAG TPA: anti-sigma factor [Blastocatellia bacterium]|nr:anti-sigma factor [Blastocatellia bacterium]